MPQCTRSTLSRPLSSVAALLLGVSAVAYGADWSLSLIAGPGLPEDLVAVPDSNWVVVSSMAKPGAEGQHGGLFAISRDDHTLHELFPANVQWGSDPAFAECPGRPDMSVAAPHGINVRKGGDGRHQVLAVNHGGREAIEIFELDVNAETPQLTWVGCVPLPSTVMTNGVAPLDDGGFVVTNMFDRSHPDGEKQMLSGGISGHVLRWHPEQGWSKVEGTDLAGPNGIEVAADGDAIYVASWTARKLHRFPLGDSQVEPLTVSVDFMPDNLRWGTDGTLLITGQDNTPQSLVSCVVKSEGCTSGFTVLAIDPDTMQTTEVYKSDEAAVHSTTVALSLGEEIWVGALSGPHIARLAPAQ